MTDTPAATPKDNQTPAEAAPAPLAGAAEFEYQVRTFWEKNRNFVYGVIAVALLAVVGREGWLYYAAQREQSVQAEFARAGDQADKLAAFAAANGGHRLAGVALLRLADRKFEAGDFKGAAEHYGKAGAALAPGLTQARAKLGEIMSRLAGGDKTGAENSLKAFLAEAAHPATIRAEVAYHLAEVQADLGKKDEALKSIEEISKIELTTEWARRGLALRLALETPKAASAPATGTVPFTVKPGSE